MMRCLQLAQKGRSSVAPNPMVGCVIVYNNTILGEGWHQKAGSSHAEVNAINTVKNPQLLKESTLYVNLEPCNHYGRTPPCAHLLVKHQIKRVVVGCLDPFKEVNGTGVQTLEKAGIEVSVGVLEQACQKLNARFFTFHEKKRPYIVLKWAQTSDHFIAPPPATKKKKAPFYISSSSDLRLVHQWRKEEAAILVGSQTVIDDNPALTTRLVQGKNPIRVLLDPKGRVHEKHRVFDKQAQTLHYTNTRCGLLEETSPKEFLLHVLDDLYKQQITSLIVEGGRYTLQQFIDLQLWDEARVYVSEKKLGVGVKAPVFFKKRNTPSMQGWQYRLPSERSIEIPLDNE